MSFSKPWISFYWNFAWFFSVMKYTSTAMFYVKNYILWKKVTNQSIKYLDYLMLRSKFSKFLSFLKQKTDFSPTFSLLFNIMRHNSCTSLAEILYNFSKRSLPRSIFAEISPEQSKVWNFALWWAFFFFKSYKVSAKKVHRTYLSWHWRVMQSFKNNWLVVSNITWGI